MKNFFSPVFLLAMVVALAGIWTFQTEGAQDTSVYFISEIIHVGLILILFAIGIWLSVQKQKNERQELPASDELSEMILLKASAYTFFISLFLWLGMLFILNKTSMEAGLLFDYGILGMATIFILCWLF